jgi:hypothetical protein
MYKERSSKEQRKKPFCTTVRIDQSLCQKGKKIGSCADIIVTTPPIERAVIALDIGVVQKQSE